MKRVDGLANLRYAAPQRSAAFADVGLAQIFVLGTEEPRRQGHQTQEWHRHEELAFHEPALGRLNDTMGDAVFMLEISVLRMIVTDSLAVPEKPCRNVSATMRRARLISTDKWCLLRR